MTDRRERELVLAPNEYAYVLDTTKGHVNCYVGPNKTSLAQTDQPVVFDGEAHRFVYVELADAVRVFATAPANWYLVLHNPARDNAHPPAGVASNGVELQVGRTLIVPGPATFPLWPGQTAELVRGHRLRSNEYLYVRVHEAAEAEAARAEALGGAEDDGQPLVTGEKRIVAGTHCRFYLPPTGVAAVPDERGRHVRRAITLGRLEYCVLEREDGRMRYVRGEAVVFPAPDERVVVRDGQRKFPAIELSETTGLHLKVIAPYTEADGTARVEGEELFLTGDGVIYFPREAHAIVRRGGRALHQAVAIPRGDGRYVLDRRTGAVRLERGPSMLLVDPRREVLTSRVLDARTLRLYHPDRQPRAAVAPEAVDTRALAGPVARPNEAAGPRVITLDTRDAGAVRVDIWAGYATQVVDPAGARRTVMGPTSLLLEFDERLQPLSLSTGTPKQSEARLDTVYLKVSGNTVSDVVEVITADLVRAEIQVAYRVDFEGDPARWFMVEDYVRLLCGHAGSKLKAHARKVSIRALQATAAAVVRDAVLGPRTEEGRPGLAFAENGMRVHEVEVLEVDVADPVVAELLEAAQREAVRGAIAVSARESKLADQQRLEAIKQAIAEAEHTTTLLQRRLAESRAAQIHDEALAAEARRAAIAEQAGARALAELARAGEQAAARRAVEAADTDQAIRADAARQTLALEELKARVEAAQIGAKAFSPQLVCAIQRLADEQLLGALAENFGELAAVEGRGLLETARRYLDFVPSTLLPVLATPGEHS